MERNSCVICEGIHFIYIYNDVATFNMATDALIVVVYNYIIYIIHLIYIMKLW